MGLEEKQAIDHNKENNNDPMNILGDEPLDQKPLKNSKSGFNRCLKVMERMIVQNKENEKYKEYRYKFTKEKPELSK